MTSNLDVLVTFPDNPNSKTEKLFPGNYLMMYNGGIDRKIDEFNGLLGGIEVHFQTFEEIALEGPEFQKILDYVVKARSNGIKLMMHAPFVKDRDPENTQPLNFNFKWFTVPREYRKKVGRKQKPVIQSPDGSVVFYAEESTYKEMKDTISLADKLGIDLLTVHVTKPGTLLKGKDWADYEKYIKKLTRFIKENDFSVKLCVETGGATEEQLVSLHEKYGTLINMDTAHYVLDLTSEEFGMSVEEANRETVKFFKKHKEYVGQVHLTQTSEHADLHKGIYEKGIMTCNEEIIRMISEDQKKGVERLCMVESRADIENFYYTAKALRTKSNSYESFLTMSLGLPATGKTETLSMIKAVFGIDILESDKIREPYDNAFSFTQMVPEIQKQLVYNEMHREAERSLTQGTGVILDATYHLKERRDQINDLIKRHDVGEVYLFQLECGDEEIKQRLKERRKAKRKAERQGRTVPKKLFDFDKYQQLRENSDPFDINEFPNAHILRYNTTEHTIDVYNNDFTTEVMIMKLRNDVKEKFDKTISVIYH